METKHWDVIIVGGGMAGLLTAYFLWEQGKHVLVLEAKEYIKYYCDDKGADWGLQDEKNCIDK